MMWRRMDEEGRSDAGTFSLCAGSDRKGQPRPTGGAGEREVEAKTIDQKTAGRGEGKKKVWRTANT